MCEKCVKVCHELIGADALYVNDKGDRAFIDKNVENCIYCGNCVSVCPTGTMISKPFKFRARPWALKKVSSVCTYCPSQCQIDLNVLNNEVYRVTSDDATTTNRGNLCVGGFFGYGYVNSKKRLTKPLINENPVSWDKALDRVVAEIERIKEADGAVAVAGFASPRLTNEENYLFQKLFRAAIGSNNIDSEAYYGAQRGFRALAQGLGVNGATGRMDAIAEADAILVFGADPSAEAPGVDWKIQDAVRRNGGQLVIANMRKLHLTQFANCQLTYKPGSEVALAKGLGKLLLDGDYVDETELQRTVSNFDELKNDLTTVDLNAVVEATGLDLQALEHAADIVGKAEKVAVIFGSDVTKSAFGTSKSAVVANLAILTGALCQGGGLFPLDEKGNTQGVLSMGVSPELLPGFQPYTENKEKFAKEWNCTLPEGGLEAGGILQEIEAGKIRFLYLAATNPLTFPNSNRWLKALEKVEVLVVQDIFPSEITKLATVVLPGCTYAEKSGSFTALDQTVRSFNQAIRPIGESYEDGQIFTELYGRLKKGAVSFSPAAVNAEIDKLTSLYADFERLNDERRTKLPPVCKTADQGLKYQLISVGNVAEGMQLLVGTSAGHFGTTSTWAPAPLEVEPEGMLRMNGDDAQAAGIAVGDKVKVSNSVGSTVGRVVIDDAIPQGLIFAPNNFIDLGIQQVLPDGDNLTLVEIAKV
jgi:formate dehydrogenase alpha subunit